MENEKLVERVLEAAGALATEGWDDCAAAVREAATSLTAAQARIRELEEAFANMLTNAELRAERDRLRKLVGGAQGILMNCDVETGICCCGDSMENHGNPMDCGHSPVDQGAYSAHQWLEEAARALKEAPDA